jgi:tRNA threonylcarbamoyladenosine biosynthesis protein TsaB
VGIATVKSFAAALGLPIVAATSLEVEAYPHAAAPWPVCAVHDAGRRELAWAVFRGPAAQWRQVTAEHITPPQELARKLRGRTLLCGEIPEWCLPGLLEALGARAVLPPPVARLRRAAALAELGFRRLEAGQVEDLHALQPLYLRRAPGSGPA